MWSSGGSIKGSAGGFERLDFLADWPFDRGAALKRADSSSGVRWYARDMKRRCVNV